MQAATGEAVDALLAVARSGSKDSDGVRTEMPEPLPKTLPGVVCRQWVRCGKPGCRCARGKPHGPYFYHFWRQAGRLHKEYVRPAEVEAVQARCHARRQLRNDLNAAWDQWRELAAIAKEAEQTWDS
jgi:hypothetical protein